VDPRAGLDVCEKSRPHRDFFYFYLFVSCASFFWYWTFNVRLYRIVLHAVDFKNPTASVGCEPAILGTRGQHANPIDHRSRFDPRTVQPVVSRYTD
jgi:hypothetical protein